MFYSSLGVLCLSSYYEVGETSFGLKLYGCKRGSSHLEGFHEHSDNAFAGFWNSPLLYDVCALNFITRWNRKCAVKNLHEPDYGHFNMELVEEVIRKAKRVGDDEYVQYKPLPPHSGNSAVACRRNSTKKR